MAEQTIRPESFQPWVVFAPKTEEAKKKMSRSTLSNREPDRGGRQCLR